MPNSEPIDIYEVPLSETTVLRLSRKAFVGELMYDLRLWNYDKKGKLYPKRQGICMRTSFWQKAIKLLNENIPVPSNTEIVGQ